MRYSAKQLQNLRSGQCVWRTLFWVGRDGKIEAQVTRRVVLGKKKLHWFKGYPELGIGPHSSVYMECRREESFLNGITEERAHFLADLMGHGAFSSKRQADRQIRDVQAGLYPEFEQYLRDMDELDREFDRALDMNEGDHYMEDIHDEPFEDPIDRFDEMTDPDNNYR